jgi:hypothetical protein
MAPHTTEKGSTWHLRSPRGGTGMVDVGQRMSCLLSVTFYPWRMRVGRLCFSGVRVWVPMAAALGSGWKPSDVRNSPCAPKTEHPTAPCPLIHSPVSPSTAPCPLIHSPMSPSTTPCPHPLPRVPIHSPVSPPSTAPCPHSQPRVPSSTAPCPHPQPCVPTHSPVSPSTAPCPHPQPRVPSSTAPCLHAQLWAPVSPPPGVHGARRLHRPRLVLREFPPRPRTFFNFVQWKIPVR